MGADGLQQEALARSVATNEEAEARPAVCHEVKVVQERLNLALAANGDVREPDAGHDAALERVDDDRGDALGHSGRVCHVRSSPRSEIGTSQCSTDVWGSKHVFENYERAERTSST